MKLEELKTKTNLEIIELRTIFLNQKYLTLIKGEVKSSRQKERGRERERKRERDKERETKRARKREREREK